MHLLMSFRFLLVRIFLHFIPSVVRRRKTQEGQKLKAGGGETQCQELRQGLCLGGRLTVLELIQLIPFLLQIRKR